jgi:hypothetical protein
MCDVRFLPQALVLQRSLERAATSYRLRVLCMDTASERCLGGLPRVETVPLAQLEEHDPALAASRGERSRQEYCWTATPAFCRFALERAGEGDVLVWVDADLDFLRDPRELVDELGDGSVLLTPHEYFRSYPTAASAAYLTERWGRFNGGAIGFRNDKHGRAAAELWRSRTLDWCHDRVEPGRFGNQLHLADFPDRFAGTRILRVPGGGLGPWNAGRYRIARNGDGLTADGRPVVFYHHQSLRLYRRPARLRAVRLPSNVFPVQGSIVGRTNPRYGMPREERNLIWRPYIRRLAGALADLDGSASLDELKLERLREDAGHLLRIGYGRVRQRLRAAA